LTVSADSTCSKYGVSSAYRNCARADAGVPLVSAASRRPDDRSRASAAGTSACGGSSFMPFRIADSSAAESSIR